MIERWPVPCGTQGFQDVEVELYTMMVDGKLYRVDNDLIQWQKDAINGEGMIPMAMQLDFEHEWVRFLPGLRGTLA